MQITRRSSLDSGPEYGPHISGRKGSEDAGTHHRESRAGSGRQHRDHPLLRAAGPDRTPAERRRYRVYSPDHVARIRFIKEAQQIGFSLAEAKELLALRADPNADCSAVQQQAIAKQQEVRRKIEQLREIDAALDTLIAACPGQGALQCCSIIDALNHRPGTSGDAAEGPPTRLHRSKK